MRTLILAVLYLAAITMLASCMTKSITQNIYVLDSHNVTISTEDSQAKPVDVKAEVPVSAL